jgi:hypothetical protein
LKKLFVYFLLVGAIACNKGGGVTTINPLSPSITSNEPTGFAPLPTNVRALASLAGDTWYGEETADPGHGENGTINMTVFTATAEGYISARLQFSNGAVVVNGSLSGDLNQLVIVADPKIGGGSWCNYSASGKRTVEGDREFIRGRYTGSGPGPCQNKQGGFVLSRAVVCNFEEILPFLPPNNAMALVPPNWPNPQDYPPQSLEIVAFKVPTLKLDWDFVTGHFSYPDVHQAHEVVRVEALSAEGVSLRTFITNDVEDGELVHLTRFTGEQFSEPVAFLRVSHGWDGSVSVPDHSVSIQSILARCAR